MAWRGATDMTQRQAIIKALYGAPRPLAIHEIPVEGVSQTSISARLREIHRDGIVQKMRAPGKKFDLWRLTPADLVLPLRVVA